MTISAQSIFDGLLPERLSLKSEADYFAPSNIALSKYWGKRDKELNLPLNSSLSISLHKWGSQTKISLAENGRDKVCLNGEAVGLEQPFARKLIAFVDRFRRGQDLPLNIQTFNSIPTAAGLASSASGFAALTGALDQTFGLGLPKDKLSMLARIGSGSASRSFWHGFVQWDRGELADGRDSFARHIDVQWPEFRIAIINVTSKPKSVSSRDGMNHTVATSPLYKVWPEQAERGLRGHMRRRSGQRLQKAGRTCGGQCVGNARHNDGGSAGIAISFAGEFFNSGEGSSVARRRSRGLRNNGCRTQC